MATYKFGKKPRRVDPRTLRFAKYLTTELPPPPASVDWQNVSPSGGWGMDGNDTLGDCVVAAAAHQIEAWSYNASPSDPENVSANECIALYDKLSPDNDGLAMLDFMNGWEHGYPLGPGTDILSAYASVNPAVQSEVQQAIAIGGGCYIGLELPNAIVNSPDPLLTPWALPAQGATGPDWSPNPNNGHCVTLLGYDSDNVYLVTWGTVIPASWAFIQAYCDEAYVLVSKDWLEAGGTSPSGLALAQLVADAKLIGENPTPNPPAPGACAEILETAEQELREGHYLDGIGGLFEYIACLAEADAVPAKTILTEKAEAFFTRVETLKRRLRQKA